MSAPSPPPMAVPDVLTSTGEGQATQRGPPASPDTIADKNFCKLHLWELPVADDDITTDPAYNDIKTNIMGAQISYPLYRLLCQLLNSVSLRMHAYALAAEITAHEHPIVFLDHHDNAPAYHLNGAEDRPDLIGVYGPDNDWVNYRVPNNEDYRGVPFPNILTVIECKPRNKNGLGQAISYAYLLMEARPDLTGVYCLSAKPQGYQVIWCDASGAAASEHISWQNLRPLASYILSLYSPPADHHLEDTSLSWVEGDVENLIVERDDSGKWVTTVKIVKQPIWTVWCGGKEYKDCRWMFTGSSWGRRTVVWNSSLGTLEFAIIKEYFRDDDRRYDEAALIRHIHSDGIVPGVVRLIAAEEVRSASQGTTITTARAANREQNIAHRTKRRIIMGSYGESLDKAKSVKDILMAIYDLLEVHRTVAIRRGVLHRDLSMYNILIYPQHRKITEGEMLMTNPPKFIDEVLTDPGKPIDSRGIARCLLIDWDNGARLERFLRRLKELQDFLAGKEQEVNAGQNEESEQNTVPEDEELACRTGTPMYIARSVSSGRLLTGRYARTFVPMPTLTGAARARYVRAHGSATYKKYCDSDGRCHGGRPSMIHQTVLEPADEVEADYEESDVEDQGDIAEYVPVGYYGRREHGEGGIVDEGSRYEDGDYGDVEEDEIISSKQVAADKAHFRHRIDHDAESVFWILLAALLRAQPLRAKVEKEPNERLATAWKRLREHTIIKGDVEDVRDGLLAYTTSTFEEVLHPKLKSLAPLLDAMAQHVSPEYAYLDPPPPLDHLHEAFRRLLLSHIVTMDKDPILLNVHEKRPVPQPAIVDAHAQATVHTTENSKRLSEAQGGRKAGVKRYKVSDTNGTRPPFI